MSNQFDEFDLARLRPLIPWAVLAAVVGVGLWTSYYTVQPEEEAVVKRFGKVIGIRGPGLHFQIPFGIDRAYPVPTKRVLKQEFGFRTVGGDQRTQYVKQPEHREESLMLTGDLKVIDVEWVVQYSIADPDKYLHRSRDPSQTLRDVSEAVMRRITGNNLGSDVITERRVQVATQARGEIQEILDTYELGLAVGTVELQDVNPPERVKPAFNEVNQAEQEKERMISEAEKRRNQVLPRAEGEALQVVSEAQGYAIERTNRARGETERFLAILSEYQQVPEVTRRRMYLEMIDNVLPKLGRVYVVEEGQTSPIPLLNLGEPKAGATGSAR